MVLMYFSFAAVYIFKDISTEYSVYEVSNFLSIDWDYMFVINMFFSYSFIFINILSIAYGNTAVMLSNNIIITLYFIIFISMLCYKFPEYRKKKEITKVKEFLNEFNYMNSTGCKK